MSVITHSKISCKTPVSGYCIIIKVINITVTPFAGPVYLVYFRNMFLEKYV